MKISVSVDDDFMKQLETLFTEPREPEDLIRSALSLLRWAAEETSRKRVILSTDQEGRDVIRLALPILKGVRNQ